MLGRHEAGPLPDWLAEQRASIAWALYDGTRSIREVASRSGHPLREVTLTLRGMADAGLVRGDGVHFGLTEWARSIL